MSTRKIVYPDGRIAKPLPGINIIDSPPNTINMVGILTGLISTDGTTPAPVGSWYTDIHVQPVISGETLQLNEISEDRQTRYGPTN